MKRYSVIGALYAEAALDGTWATLVPGAYIETSRGNYSLPPGGDLLFLRMTVYQGQLLLAGQGHDDGNCWLYDHPQWRNVGPTFGVSPCVFGDGKLFIAIAGDTVRTVQLDNGTTWDGPLAIGSQGLRYVENGQPVTGDASFREGDLFEFTRLGDVMVGQGGSGGCVIDGRVLEPGDCRFVRASRHGDNLAVAIVKIPERMAVFYWLTTDVIPSLPPVQSEPPPPPPPPPPPEKTMQAPNRQSVVAKHIAQHPEWATDETLRGKIIDLACVEANQTDGGRWGRKSRNAAGTDLNTDAMCWKRDDGQHEIYDAITGSGQASWDSYGPFKAGENGYWVPSTGAPDVPPPPPPDDTVAHLTKSVAALTARADAQQAQLTGIKEELLTAANAYRDLIDRVTTLEQKPGSSVAGHVRGKTSAAGGGWWGKSHTHDVDLTVTPE